MLRKDAALILAASVLSITACQSSNDSASSGASSAGVPSSFDLNRYAVNNTSCDPLGGGSGSGNPIAGLKANLYYMNAGEQTYNDVESMISHGHASKEDLFFSQLYVPTRMFSAGFPLESGGMIKSDDGVNLIEYFALRFQGFVQLGPDDLEGDYQLGLLSDDGAIWSLSSNAVGNAFEIVVNNDGTHPTQLDCGPIVSLKKGQVLRMQLDYYQGPRYHIALIPIWRKVSAPSSEPRCGQLGNNLWFDPNNNSKPQAAYLDLQSRGWRPLTKDNYAIPSSAAYNPCTQGTAPKISGFIVKNTGEGPYLVAWTTDIPASTQVLYIDHTTGIQTLTESDNMLRTSHQVTINLISGHSYSIQAVSISSDLGKSLSQQTNLVAQ